MNFKNLVESTLNEAAPKTISDLPAFLDKKRVKYEYNPKKAGKINITGLGMDIVDEFDGRKLKFYSTTPEHGTAMYTKMSNLMKVINSRIKTHK